MSTALTDTHARQSRMRNFDPIQVAHYEKEAWVAYYRRKWFALLRLLIGLARSTYGLSLLEALQVGLPLTRTQLAFAPQDNDVPKAIEQMEKFFVYLKEQHGEELDPHAAAL